MLTKKQKIVSEVGGIDDVGVDQSVNLESGKVFIQELLDGEAPEWKQIMRASNVEFDSVAIPETDQDFRDLLELSEDEG